ncbi:5'-3' DNA helicase ZGRF1 isoform X9 [Symphalangus syndactylus]|uniref:5'-3' DNA helicase ZGRF1 isoform X9 n=1 Tax=Symphalangus syndactylus TaxID=9590 RepID=UPI002441448E|nr:protein ZGRF1 isoform X7 [Symphalangus syndactylus]
MESQEFIVLYTHQKMKKSKVWQDGILKITHLGNKAILFDDKGACLESLFLKCLEVKPGDDLESDRYLITVEEVKVAGAIGVVKQNVNKEAPDLNSRTFISSGRSLGCQPSGLKRKFTGFQGPRQVPKKMVITESGESAASHEAKKTGPTIFSPFYSMPPLFPTVGKKDTNNILADPENIVAYKNRERNAMDFSSVFSPSFQINPGVLCEENYFCSPVNSGNKLSDSLLTNEPVKRDSLASHYSGVSQNIRSKAQILALLKSESSSSCEELNSEMTEHFPQKQPQGSLKIATKPKYLIQQEKCAEMKSTENLYYQHQSENTMRNKSRWAMYLSSQSSPIHSSTVDGNDTERKPKAQEYDINSNLKDLSLQKNIQFFETCAEERKKYNVDKSVGNDQSWNQEVKLEIPSFNESSSLRVTCSSAGNDGTLSESDIQEDNKIPFNQNDKGYFKGSVLMKENAQEVNTCGTPEKEYEQSESSLPELKHLQIESSNNSRISDDITDMISESKMDNESLNSIHESLSNVTQPFLEVTFNLNNFETSDTEEESQENNKISQDSESWVKDILVNDSNSCFQKRSENTNCEEIEGEHLPFLTSVSDKPTVTFPVKETLPSQFCDKTYVGFDMGICKAENTGKEIEEYSDTLSNFESFKWTDAVYIDNKEDANKPIQEVRINYDFALPPNKSKGINMNLHIPHNQNQIAENSDLFSEDAQPQPFILGSDLDKNDEHVLPSTSSSDNSVQLLNTNQNHYECIALDKSNTHISSSLFYPLGKNHLISKDTEAHISEPEDLGKIRSPPPDHVEVETAREGKQHWNPRNSSELSGLVNTISILKSLSEHSTALDSLEILKKKNTVFQQGTQQTYEPDSSPEVRKPFITVVSPKSPHLHKDSQQVTSPEQNVSTLSPVSTFSLNSRDEDFMIEFSETSLKARTLPDDLHFLNLEGMKKSRSLENENLQRLSLLSRTQVPLITLPPTDGPPDLDSHSYMINSNTYESSGSPRLNLSEKSAVLSFSIEPEDQNETSFSEESREVTPGDVSLLNNISTQSKWLKYQNTSQCNVTTPNRVDKRITDGFFAEAVSGMHFRDTSKRQSDAVNESSLDSVHLQMIKGMLYQQQQNFSSQDLVSRKKVLSLNLKQTSKTEEIKNVLGGSTCYNYSVKDLQEISGSELCFPSGQKIKSAYLPQRQIHIPAVFQSPAHYKQTFTSCLIEHLNILLFGLAQNLHKALSKVDISFYTSLKGEKLKNVENNVPSCHHSQPAKLVMVKKEGPNKGRLFYTCDGRKADRCQFFKWLEDVTPGYSIQEGAQPGMVLSDIKGIGLYLRSQKIPLYEECQLLVRKGFDFQRKQYGKLKKFTTVNPEFYNEPKTKLYLKLSRKESSSAYSKNDLWVVSKTVDFELDTFIACSAFFGPSSINEIEILPLKGYFPSNWPTNMVVHALLVCNASTELTTLKNLQDYFNPATLPLTQYLLTMSSPTIVSNKRVSKRKFIPPAFTNVSTKFELLSLGATLKLASELIQVHKLNKDQATALIQIAQMMASHESTEEVKELQTHTLPITIIHGVFGAGKSYLLAVVILFFVQLFEKSEAPTIGNARPWKLLISSSTNVAVDRVLLGLLGLGFENFIRVGSVRKIAKPILPYSLHAGSENESEQLKELHALMKEDLTSTERVYVRKSIEQHKLGTNRTLLKQVRVVGVTCAACPFPCMNDLKFPVVVLDECSQITEPTSLLPIARFECEKLILVGDPKQLPPTIQGSDAAHENGLEQTLFDRLCLMGHKPILLRTQYRCHPAISAIANDLFYKGALMNGVTEIERSPLLEWLPTLCFYNVKGLEQIERDNSFHNVAEATFTLKLIQSLIASGIAGSMIGVITLYKSQMYKLCHLLSAVDFHHPDIKTVQVSTVDAFQGAEKEIIILSCVRTRQVGFIDSEKRMNVALTRGKRHLLIVGNLACLRKNQLWGRVIQHCEGREDGLQHANQYEPQLNHLLKDYFEKQAEEKQKKKSEKDKSKDKSYSQKDMV